MAYSSGIISFLYIVVTTVVISMLTCACTGNEDIFSPDKTISSEEFISTYHLGPGDILEISVFEEPGLSGRFKINGSGAIIFPLAGEIKLEGLVLKDASDLIERRLEDGFLHDARVSLKIADFRPYYILGEVRNPGVYDYREGMRVLNAIAAAGGFTYRADKGKVKIVRENKETSRVLKRGVHSRIFPGDIIYLEERIF
jgi:polysaccharide export outer membrane protein